MLHLRSLCHWQGLMPAWQNCDVTRHSTGCWQPMLHKDQQLQKHSGGQQQSTCTMKATIGNCAVLSTGSRAVMQSSPANGSTRDASSLEVCPVFDMRPCLHANVWSS